MGTRKARMEVDTETGEILADLKMKGLGRGPLGENLIDFPDLPVFDSPKNAVLGVSKQQAKVDQAEQFWQDAKLAAKDAALELEREQSILRLLLRGLRQMNLFGLLFALFGALCFAACAPAGAQGQLPGGSTQGWDDDWQLSDRYHVEQIEPGVAVLVNERTGAGWLLVGSSQSWQAIQPLGQL